MGKLKVGNYIRGSYYQYRGKIGKIIKNYNNELGIAYKDSIVKTTVCGFIDDNFDVNGCQYKESENIIDLIQPMDLLFVDIDNGYEGGIIVPKIAETMNELNEIKSKIKSGNLKLKYIVTREQIENLKYEVE